MRAHLVAFLALAVTGLSSQAQGSSNLFIDTKPAHPEPISTPALTNLNAGLSPVIPPTYFNEGVFSQEERTHDTQISDITGRVQNLEGTSYWVRGVVYGAGFFILLLAAFVRAFWRGIVRVVLNEADPRIIRP